MGGVILENLSNRKLGVLAVVLVLCQVACFLIGGLIAPSPSGITHILATKCIDKSGKKELLIPRSKHGKTCQSVQDFTDPLINEKMISANDMVFAFQFPLPRDDEELDYSRWHQNLIGVLQPDIAYKPKVPMKPNVMLTLDVRLAYRNRQDKPDDWKLLSSSLEERKLECHLPIVKEDYLHNCSLIPLFELGNVHHDFYLLNIRVPVKEGSSMNDGIGSLTDMWLVAIHQNGGFTKVWLSLKTVFFPCIIAVLAWFWNRINQLARPPVLLEKMLFGLGLALSFLNMPLEFLTLAFDMPYMLLISDIRQGIFYAALLSFWLIFAGEHMMVDDIERNRLGSYWKNLSAVVFGCLCLFVFDMCDRGVQLTNPFYSIWVTDVGTKLALAFIILAGVSACIYFLFLSYMIFKVFKNISHKKMSLPAMSSARRLFYEGVIYRFKFLMLVTLICAALTVIFFIIGQVSEGRWKWDEDIQLEYTSAFFCGVYGMWNIYVFALIVLYAPSHKRWPTDNDLRYNTTEEIEFSPLNTSEPTEISALTSIAKKSTTD